MEYSPQVRGARAIHKVIPFLPSKIAEERAFAQVPVNERTTATEPPALVLHFPFSRFYMSVRRRHINVNVSNTKSFIVFPCTSIE